jgi:hypothetical protein
MIYSLKTTTSIRGPMKMSDNLPASYIPTIPPELKNDIKSSNAASAICSNARLENKPQNLQNTNAMIQNDLVVVGLVPLSQVLRQ